MKPGLSLRIIGTVLAVSILFFSLLAYFNIKHLKEALQTAHMQKERTVAAPIHIAEQTAGTYQIEMTLEDMDRSIQTAVTRSVLSYSAVLVFFVFVLIGALRLIITSPVHGLSSAAGRLAADLKKSHQQIETQRVALEKELTERENVEARLRESQEKYHSEQRNLKAQLMQAQKMESMGALAAGIAHDFNNILTPIISQSALALMDDGIDSTIQNSLQEVMKAGLRAKGLVKQILAFSHQTDQQPIPLKITPITREALKLLRASLPTNIEIRVNLTDGFDTVIADPTQIHQILINLCTNAAYSMRDKKGILEVGLTDIQADSDFTAKHSELEPGPYLKLAVSDTGHGIAPEVMDRIFEPFFTTKGRGEGTGMGLAVIHGIIKECGGIITVDTELGKGTTFNVFLPLVEAVISEKIESDTQLPSGNERVLVVDDEAGTVNTLRDMLEWLGYQVLDKTSSQDALEVFGAEPDRFDLVLTDQAMPNMTGMELAKMLKSIRSDIPIVLCTGFSETVNKESVKAMGISEFLLKPVEIDELAQVIRKVLDKE